MSRCLDFSSPSWRETSPPPSPSGIRRLSSFFASPSFSLDTLDLLPLFPKWSWLPRNSSHHLHGLGSVFSGSLSDTLATLRLSSPEITAFGGSRFNPASPTSPTWSDFPTEFFWVPRWEISPANQGFHLSLHLLPHESPHTFTESLVPLFSALPPSLPSANAISALPKNRNDFPDFSTWRHSVEKALSAIHTGSLKKVVLARESVFFLDSSPSPGTLLQRLASSASPSCFLFSIQPSATSACFLGASPELLYRRSGKKIESEALAGTRPRSANPQTDFELGQTLLHDTKEQNEHSIVALSLQTIFSHLCSSPAPLCPPPALLKLSHLQHLYTPFSGCLKDGIDDPQILSALHPTPATCGYPSPLAHSFLLQNEPFDRGWYSGPIGIVSSDAAEFAVAIRSCLSAQNQLHLFAGAGIVLGSSPQQEWEELENKISASANLFSL